MDELSQHEAVVRLIRIQCQMLETLEYVRRDVANAVIVMSALDECFAEAFFARKLAVTDDMPGTIPSKDVLMEALKNLGWTQDTRDGLKFFTSIQGFHKDPWLNKDVRKTTGVAKEVRRNRLLDASEPKKER